VDWAEATEKESDKNRLTAKITAFIGASEIGQLKPGVVGQEYKCSAYFTTCYDLSSSRTNTLET